jgi:GNAT superfamily N-acetyltransferase
VELTLPALPAGLHPLAPGDLACVVTSLEMLEPPRPAPEPASPLQLVRWPVPAAAKYRALYTRVGAPWLWSSRLVLEPSALEAIIHDRAVEVYAVADRAGIEVGILELDFRDAGACELAFFGLIPQLSGQGHGRWLMARALRLAWRAGVARVWVHTCTLDDPRALGFYIAQGFRPFARAVEVFADPRAAGLVPPNAGPRVPRLG